jgi:carboxypeptidase Q
MASHPGWEVKGGGRERIVVREPRQRQGARRSGLDEDFLPADVWGVSLGLPFKQWTLRRIGGGIALCLLSGCGAISLKANGLDDLLRKTAAHEARGEFLSAGAILDQALSSGAVTPSERQTLDFERQRLDRIQRDFPLTRDDLIASLQKAVADLTMEEFEQWEREGRFDSLLLDGERRYFVSSVSNLFFRHPDLEARRVNRRDTSAVQRAYLRNARDIREAARAKGTPYVLPKRFQVRMSVAVKPGSAAAGAMIRAWLPVPREFPHQSGYELVGTVPAGALVAASDSPIRSVYLEQPATEDGSATFKVDYAYTAHGVWFDLENPPLREGPGSGAVSTDELDRFLAEGPHVEFTPGIRVLAAKLRRSGDRDRPVDLARRFYRWISENIRYSYAPEYSTVRHLGEACRADGRGDCGQAAFLFMALCRHSGIPARWQSGWSLFPGAKTIHDWCEVSLEPWGWVPVDPYMGVYAQQYASALSEQERSELRDFYFGGLTQYRMAANSDHNQPLSPFKASPRSDPVDFQRGEIEAGGTNVYYDRFSYRLAFEEIPPRFEPAEREAFRPDLEFGARLIHAATNSTLAYSRLAELCDTFGPRFSGTTNLEAAIDWALETLRSDGFENVRGEPVRVPRWVRGEESLEQISPRPMSLPVLGLGGTTNTPASGITAPVLVVTNFAELEARADEVAGRIAVFHPPFVSYNDIVRYRYQGASAAARAGAVASLVRSATPFSLQTPHTGGMRYEAGVRPIPHAAITIEEAERLLRLQLRGITPVLKLTLGARSEPEAVSRNVVAELRGRDRPEEIIVVGGHIDSWDVGQGALDDAGGCFAAWEALRLLKGSGYRPRRTLRLVLWTNEENGLGGARAYPEQHRDELPRHVVAIESDWGIGPVLGFAFTGSERANAQLRELLPLMKPLGGVQLRPGAGGSDLGPLLEEGVPIMNLWTDRGNYFWFHHTEADTVDKVDPTQLNLCVAHLALMLYGLGEMPEPLAR